PVSARTVVVDPSRPATVVWTARACPLTVWAAAGRAGPSVTSSAPAAMRYREHDTLSRMLLTSWFVGSGGERAVYRGTIAGIDLRTAAGLPAGPTARTPPVDPHLLAAPGLSIRDRRPERAACRTESAGPATPTCA